MKLRFSEDARDDLRDISEYTRENWGGEQEDSYLRSIYARLSEIKEDPARWKKRDDLFEGCQVALVGKHLLFFKHTDHEILISRVLHQAMDVPKKSFPL